MVYSVYSKQGAFLKSTTVRIVYKLFLNDGVEATMNQMMNDAILKIRCKNFSFNGFSIMNATEGLGLYLRV